MTSYDTIIVGGGIAGLYSAYRLLKSKPDTKLLLLEKQSYLGGRIFTYHDDTITVEGGAGRFTKHHARLWKLLNELGLASKAVPISGGFTYVDGEGPEEDISEVVKASKSETLAYLRSVSFLNFAKHVIGAKRAQHIVDSFGYYSELILMNAHDAIVLMDVLENPAFFSLAGGLSQIITELEKRIRGYPNAKIQTGVGVDRFVQGVAESGGRRKSAIFAKEANSYELRSPEYFTVLRTRRNSRFLEETKSRTKSRTKMEDLLNSFHLSNGESVFSRRAIFAVPKQALEKLTAFRPLRPWLNQIACGSLCRIYSQFQGVAESVGRSKSAIFGRDEVSYENATSDGLSKIYDKKWTMNNDLRMIIPIDRKKGVVMISYTDNKYADAWHAMEKKPNGLSEIDAKIAGLVRDTFMVDIPKPVKTKVFYWPCGVGYWKVGANSSVVSRRMVRPFPGREVYVCGEHYSEKNQQWIEGALETSDAVLAKIKEFRKFSTDSATP